MSVNMIASFPPFELEGNGGQSAIRGREGINVSARTIFFVLWRSTLIVVRFVKWQTEAAVAITSALTSACLFSYLYHAVTTNMLQICSAGGRTPAACTFCLQPSQMESVDSCWLLLRSVFIKQKHLPRKGNFRHPQTLSYTQLTFCLFKKNTLCYKVNLLFFFYVNLVTMRLDGAKEKRVFLKRNMSLNHFIFFFWT